VTDSERRSPDSPDRLWFGPKRVGWGLRPQTWQGWAVTLAVIIAVIIILAIVR
jgi:hypothetical protein